MDTVQRRLRRLFAFRRGVLAVDTGPASLAARFRAACVVPSAQAVRDYRAMLLGADDLASTVSGVVLPPELFDAAPHGRSLPEQLRACGILPGVRADTGQEQLTASPGDRVTSGLDGLATRLFRLRELGAAFAVWSTVAGSEVGDRSMQVLTANSHAAARFAHLCHDLGLVAVVRVGTRVGDAAGPRRDATMAAALLSVGGHFDDQDVDTAAVVICAELGSDGCPDVASRPLTVLPGRLGGVLLSGRGAAVADATAAVAAGVALVPPWPVSFYAGRHVTVPALQAWRGGAGSVADGQRALLGGLEAVSAAAAPAVRAGW
jgi:fructose-bisphosphate aldolase class I